MESMRAIRVGAKGQFHRPIVRQVYNPPIAITERYVRRAATGSGLVQAQGASPIITQVKSPAGIHEQPFPVTA